MEGYWPEKEIFDIFLNVYLFSNGREVAVVYLRALYTPDDLKSENVSLLLLSHTKIQCIFSRGSQYTTACISEER